MTIRASEAEKDAQVKALADAGMDVIEALGLMAESDADGVAVQLADVLPEAAEKMIRALRLAGRL